ncbi:hypothetical protein HK100_009336 [Physocladia obscura]|uniref:Uncharacterized protein n=1 Tax=Physocladia obscura TaxID=109957 RepID=A0AAD5T3D6_9FUNG|nr:hypothetical protein HK100_009336 [Physocladia obscura]
MARLSLVSMKLSASAFQIPKKRLVNAKYKTPPKLIFLIYEKKSETSYRFHEHAVLRKDENVDATIYPVGDNPLQ